VADALAAAGIATQVVTFAESTRTAEDAAAAIGCEVGQIVKSLVFMAGDEAILALVSGVNRADTARLAALAGAPIRRADANAVRSATGYAIGGVAPVGHPAALRIWLDEDLMRYGEVWAAAGTPNTVFRITPVELQRVTGAQVAKVASG
jgi:prolyl-tRNA editing enzyme YbaK/EbsC (Cys-tRNA(Pro) deacylase)